MILKKSIFKIWIRNDIIKNAFKIRMGNDPEKIYIRNPDAE